MEKDIIGKIDKSKDITEPVLTKILDEVKKKYEQMKDIDKDELEKMVDTLRNHWSKAITAK